MAAADTAWGTAAVAAVAADTALDSTASVADAVYKKMLPVEKNSDLIRQIDFSGQNLFWKKRGEFWFTNASMDFFDFFFKYGLVGTTIFMILLTRGLIRSFYESNVRNNIAIILFFAYSFFGGHVIDSVTSGSLFYYLLATMKST